MKNDIPTHVAIIMDGNGRWATRQGLKRTEGHKQGYKTLKKTVTHIFNKEIKYLSLYAFSTENFGRSEEEVNCLMELFLLGFKKDRNYFKNNNIKVLFSGRKEPLRDDVYKTMKEFEKYTSSCNGGIINICLNYGGQSEIVDATKKIVELVKENKLDINDLNTKNYYQYLYQDLPPVDLMIRTSGELRISNFMLYSLSYAELYFTNTCFPDFDEHEFDLAIEEYQNRHITKGKI